MRLLCVLLQLLELASRVDCPGEAVVIESTSVKGLGNVADCVVRWGTLKVGDHFVVGKAVRSLLSP